MFSESTISRAIGEKRDVRFVEPNFPLETTSVEAFGEKGVAISATLTLPVNHAKTPKPLHLILRGPSGTGFSPFQFEDMFGERGSHPTGGLALFFEQQLRLLLFSLESPNYGFPFNEFLGVFSTTYLRKENPDDLHILVKPTLNRRPYVLENKYEGRPGLLIIDNKLVITGDPDRSILVERQSHPARR